MKNASLSITALSEETGVNPVTLRAWERRYGLLRPSRTGQGYRQYSPDSVARVRSILDWVEKGVAISRVRDLIDQGAPAANEQVDERAPFLEALEQGQWRRAERCLDEWMHHYPVAQVITRLLMPAMDTLLHSQRPGDAGRAALLRTLVEQKCQSRLLSALPTRRQPGVLLVALEEHSLSALYIALLLRERGCTCVLVHAPVPPSDYALLAAAETVSALLLVVPPSLSATGLRRATAGSLSRIEKPVCVVGESLPSTRALPEHVRAGEGDLVALADFVVATLVATAGTSA